jgi:hypothetical protein
MTTKMELSKQNILLLNRKILISNIIRYNFGWPKKLRKDYIISCKKHNRRNLYYKNLKLSPVISFR